MPVRLENLMTGSSGRLHGRLWIGDQDPVGVVVVVHGLGDHGGRYEALAQSIVENDWAVFVFDLPGHGQSPGDRGRVDSFDGLLADIAHARRTVGDRLPNLPQVLLGHSMGGTLAINYVLRRRETNPQFDQLAGLILCAPMLLPPSPPPRPHIFAAWLTGRLLPWIRISRPVDVETLTGDPEQAAAIRDDSLIHSQITIYLATQLLSQGRWALDHARDIDVPTLIMHGEDDELIDKSACEHLPIRMGSSATLVRWPEMRHDLFHDTHKGHVFDRIAEWLRHFASTAEGNIVTQIEN
jgi:alpha-beta hydrolase superfamily lysophospholipase